jgi:hypothetical protein
LGIFLEITAVAKFLACLFHGESCALILAKNGWTKLWAIFPQTHLVTLSIWEIENAWERILRFPEMQRLQKINQNVS